MFFSNPPPPPSIKNISDLYNASNQYTFILNIWERVKREKWAALYSRAPGLWVCLLSAVFSVAGLKLPSPSPARRIYALLEVCSTHRPSPAPLDHTTRVADPPRQTVQCHVCSTVVVIRLCLFVLLWPQSGQEWIGSECVIDISSFKYVTSQGESSARETW